MPTKRERVIELVNRITAIRAAHRNELPKLEAELDALIADRPSRHPLADVSEDAAITNGHAHQDTSDGANVVAAILEFLGAHPGTPFKAPVVAEKINASHRLTTVRSALIRLADQKRIKRASRGSYSGKAENG
jgi:hypothetical protein